MLEEVLALFCERYGLKGPDDSEGCRVIQAAISGTASIAQVRQVLTTKYELYPQIEGRVLEILDSLEEAATETSETASTDAAVVEEPEAALPTPPPAPTPAKRKGDKR